MAFKQSVKKKKDSVNQRNRNAPATGQKKARASKKQYLQLDEATPKNLNKLSTQAAKIQGQSTEQFCEENVGLSNNQKSFKSRGKKAKKCLFLVNDFNESKTFSFSRISEEKSGYMNTTDVDESTSEVFRDLEVEKNTSTSETHTSSQIPEDKMEIIPVQKSTTIEVNISKNDEKPTSIEKLVESSKNNSNLQEQIVLMKECPDSYPKQKSPADNLFFKDFCLRHAKNLNQKIDINSQRKHENELTKSFCTEIEDIHSILASYSLESSATV